VVIIKKKSKKIHGRYGKFNEERSFGKYGKFKLDLVTSHSYVLAQEKRKRKNQDYNIRSIKDPDTDFWRLYIQKKKKK